MTTVSQVSTGVLNRLEENPAAPVFWTLQEIYAIIVEAMNEAALITGYVQSVNNQVTIPAGTNYVPMPKGWISILTIRGPQAIRKTEVWAMDQLNPGWEGAIGSTAISAWFPVGLTSFGVYPQLAVPQTVNITALAYPVTIPRPYTGNETVPFDVEFIDGIESYAASVARYKESGMEMETAASEYQQFLTTMQGLSAYMDRHDSLVFSRTVGGSARVNPVMTR